MSTKEPQITFTKSSPYIVKNIEVVKDSDGKDLPSQPTMAFCRCGLSDNPPFCDGKHVHEGFKNLKGQESYKSKVKEYKGKDITVYFNLSICAHVAVCINNLPGVFNLNKRPWVNPDGAKWEEIVKVIDACPSGALRYKLNGIDHQSRVREQKITVVPNGPLSIEGGIKLTGDMEPPIDEERYCLCRCGKTNNTPFCDGSHNL